jgi:pimeloyl-ACP methyl ester carboxylesterase
MTEPQPLTQLGHEQKPTKSVSQEVQKIFGLPENHLQAEWRDDMAILLYGDQKPDEIGDFQVENRTFGYELYRPEGNPNGTWLITQHGDCGNPRDWAKLAKLAISRGFGLLALDMHKAGQDEYERMSMILEQWEAAAKQAPEILRAKQVAPRKTIFVGQSSGGSAGASLAVKGRGENPYDAMYLIGPTLANTDPGTIATVNLILDRNLKPAEDFMLDWAWLAPLLPQLKDEQLNQAYAGYLSTLPGLPWRNSQDSLAVNEAVILEKLGGIDVPVVFGVGEFDTVDKVSPQKLLERLDKTPNPQVKIEKIAGSGHQAEIEKQEAIMAAIERLTGSL